MHLWQAQCSRWAEGIREAVCSSGIVEVSGIAEVAPGAGMPMGWVQDLEDWACGFSAGTTCTWPDGSATGEPTPLTNQAITSRSTVLRGMACCPPLTRCLVGVVGEEAELPWARETRAIVSKGWKGIMRTSKGHAHSESCCSACACKGLKIWPPAHQLGVRGQARHSPR